MRVVKSNDHEVVVGFTDVEVRALRNLLEGADLVPLEAKGPPQIFRRLLGEFRELPHEVERA